MVNNEIPIWEKVTLTVSEASKYSNIGEKTLRNILKEPSCPFVFSVGNKYLIKRKEFENFIMKHNSL